MKGSKQIMEKSKEEKNIYLEILEKIAEINERLERLEEKIKELDK